MVIMIFFLILSVLAVIVTFIYLKKDQKKVKQKNISNENQVNNKKNNNKQLKDILGLKISNSMINIDSNYSCILKIGSIDYHMMSEKEQEKIEEILMKTARAFDGYVQFLTTMEKIDTNEVINDIKKSKASNMQIRYCKENLIKFLVNMMEEMNTSINRNYIIVSYDGLYEEATKELNRKISNLKANLSSAKIQCELLNDEEIYNLLYKELNKNSNIIKMNFAKEGLYVKQKEKNNRRK